MPCRRTRDVHRLIHNDCRVSRSGGVATLRIHLRPTASPQLLMHRRLNRPRSSLVRVQHAAGQRTEVTGAGMLSFIKLKDSAVDRAISITATALLAVGLFKLASEGTVDPATYKAATTANGVPTF